MLFSSVLSFKLLRVEGIPVVYHIGGFVHVSFQIIGYLDRGFSKNPERFAFFVALRALSHKMQGYGKYEF